MPAVQRSAQLMDEDDLDLRGLIHTADWGTSVAAAVHQKEHRSVLQNRIEVILQTAALTDEELRLLPEFSHYAESTVRKRRTELLQQKRVEAVGRKFNSRGFMMTIWAAVRPKVAAPPTPKRRSLLPPAPTVQPRKKKGG